MVTQSKDNFIQDPSWDDLSALNEREVARVAIRVSKVRGKDEDTRYSSALQLDDGSRYCAFKRLDLDTEASTANKDEDVSGFRKPWRKRPGLMRHYEAAKRREFKHLVFYKLSRLGRNVKESLDLIDAFEQEGVTIHVVKENIDSNEASGRFLRTVLLAAAEMQSEDTSQFIQAAIQQRAKAAKVQHGALPMWIARASNRDGYEIIPEQAVAFRRMVELRMVGTGYVKLARQLNVEGFCTINGKDWTDTKVAKYLSSTWIDTMEGTGYLNRHGESGTNAQPRIERTVIPHLFPALLSEEEADALRIIQQRYSNLPLSCPIPGGSNWSENKQRKKKGGRYSATTEFLLSSLVFCATCGERLGSMCASDDHRASKHKYGCVRARTNTVKHSDGGVNICGWILEDAVLRLVRQVLQEPPAPGPKPRKAVQSTTPQKLREELARRSDLLLDLVERNKISENDFDRRYAQIQSERDALDAREAEETAPAARDAAFSILSQSEDQEITREQLRQLILLIVKRVDAAVTIEGEHVRGPKTGLRRFARVTLHFATASGHTQFLVPLYKGNFSGEKEAPRPVY